MYRVNNRGETLELLIYEDIGEGWFGGVSSKQIKSDLSESNASTVNVRINSPGGDVFEGLAIYNALRDTEARVEVDIDALAASAASVVAMAGDEIRMADNALFMIHNAWTVHGGDANEFERIGALLRQINENLVKTYAARTELQPDELADMMDAETWLGAEQAQELGFVDTVSEGLSVAACAFDRKRYRNTPERLRTQPNPPARAWKAKAADRLKRLEVIERGI